MSSEIAPLAPPLATATPQSEQAQDPTSAPAEPSQVEDDDEYLISCRCESARAVSTLLSCLRHVASSNSVGESSARDMSFTQKRRSTASASAIQPVTVFCSPTNLTFHVYGKAKQTQASVDMQSGLFSEFRIAQTAEEGQDQEEWQAGGEFCVNLTSVLDCLHILGTQSLDKTTLCFTYNLTKEIFKIELLEESGVLSTAAIPGMLPPEDDMGNSLALAFRSSPIAARIIFKADTLRELLPELELVTGATFGTVVLGPNGLEMAAVGHLGECQISVPSKGMHVVSIEIPMPSQPAVPRTYPLHSLLGSMKGLEIAEETCITMNANGMMAIQHQVLDQQAGNGNPNFVDFIMCCLEDDDDDDDEEEDEERQGGDDQASSQNSTQASAATGWTQTQTQESTRGQSVRSSRSISGLTEADSSRRGYDDEEDSDEEQSLRPASSAAPLFGTVVRDVDVSPSSEAASRSVRRRTRRPLSSSARRIVDDDDDDGDDNGSESDSSRNLLADTDSEREEETEPLDVTISTSGRRRRDNRADECPSPEVVYEEH
jgi:hypothetical protein